MDSFIGENHFANCLWSRSLLFRTEDCRGSIKVINRILARVEQLFKQADIAL